MSEILKNSILVISVFLNIVFVLPAKAAVEDEIANRQRKIEEYQRKIDEYQQQIEQTQSTSRTLENEIKGLNAKISQLTLEIRSLELSINQTNFEINDTEEKITDAGDKISKHRGALAEYLKAIYETDQKSLTEILLQNANLSDFFTDLDHIRANQDNLRASIQNIRQLKADLEQRQEELEDKRTDLERLRKFQALEKRNLDSNKSQKNKILKDTKGQEVKFQELVKRSKKDIEAIKSQITYLQQNGVTAEEAVKFGQLAAIATGIRPAFLIAILEVESGLGKNVGTGNWLADMYQCYLRLGKPSRAEAEKAAFFTIITKLGLDASTVKVSREPNYGCGGALGPAQFLPTTWLGYEEQTARLTGHNPPSPWNIEDAFMASALKLANGGATSKDKTGETRAAKAYISGKPSCTSRICNYYTNAVLRKAAEIEKNL
ncbi:MAG: lytic murein transglycosylase [Candidatus Taylorbacteria bacterium]|nr:lytic murein transglycosylase [Candidatus Taylorbacteria bacterium]